MHLLVTITGPLSLSRTIARLKFKTRRELATADLSWQSNYFDHRLRPDDHISTLLGYMVLNPVRGKLVVEAKAYAYVWLGEEESKWFEWPRNTEAMTHPAWMNREEPKSRT